MPYVNIQITKGATRAQKAQLVKDVTDSLEHVLGKKPEHGHMVIQNDIRRKLELCRFIYRTNGKLE